MRISQCEALMQEAGLRAPNGLAGRADEVPLCIVP
jgi:hypothetical protein